MPDEQPVIRIEREVMAIRLAAEPDKGKPVVALSGKATQVC
jgi:hypothetical protein